MSRGERKVLSSCIEVPSVRESSSSDLATRRQWDTAVPFSDDPQSDGGSGGCVVCFYHPRFVFLHANCRIITNPDFALIWRCLVRVCREPTKRRQIGVELDEEGLDGRPPLITSHVWYNRVDLNGIAPVSKSHCRARVVYEERKGAGKNSPR